MNSKKIKLGIFGLIRGMHVAETVLDSSDVEITAICDKNKELLESAGSKVPEAKRFESYEKMLETDIDAVYAANYAIEHTPASIEALNAGKHVLSEIPAVTSVDEAIQLKKTVLDHPDQIYMFAENCCWWANMETWKKIREEGKLGDIVYAEGEYLHAAQPKDISPDLYPKGHWRTFNPAIRYLTHELGPLLQILDDRVVTVTCMEPDIIYNPYKSGSENGIALFKTAKGTVINITVCFGAYCGATHNYRLIGTRGMIETDRTKNISEAHTFVSMEDMPGTFYNKSEMPITISYPGEGGGGHGGADKRMMLEFIRCVKEGTQPVLNVDKAIQFSLPGVIAHESALKKGCMMEIPEI